MTILRIGATKQYSDNWEKAFGRQAKKKTAGEKTAAKKKSPSLNKSARKKSSVKKRAKK